jgi:hypothetical protein
MGSQTRARPSLADGSADSSSSGGPDDFSDLDSLAGNEFSRLRQVGGNEPSLAPAPAPAAPVQRPTSTSPDSFFFPVNEAPRQPFSRLRK